MEIELVLGASVRGPDGGSVIVPAFLIRAI